MARMARRLLTLSRLTTGVGSLEGGCVSLPRVVGRKGIVSELRPDLSNDEHRVLHRSAEILKDAAVSLKML